MFCRCQNVRFQCLRTWNLNSYRNVAQSSWQNASQQVSTLESLLNAAIPSFTQHTFIFNVSYLKREGLLEKYRLDGVSQALIFCKLIMSYLFIVSQWLFSHQKQHNPLPTTIQTNKKNQEKNLSIPLEDSTAFCRSRLRFGVGSTHAAAHGLKAQWCIQLLSFKQIKLTSSWWSIYVLVCRFTCCMLWKYIHTQS